MDFNSKEKFSQADSSTSLILTQLNQILSSDLFIRSSVLSSFLKFIVMETLENQTEGLKEYTIAVSALGKPSEFNPQLDAIVRIHAGRLRRLLSEYYLGPGLSDPIRIEVIKGSYVPVFRANSSTSKISIAEKNEPIPYSRSKLTLAVLPFRNLCAENEYQFFADGFGEELTRLFSGFQNMAVIAHHSTRQYAMNPGDVRQIGVDLGAHYLISGSVKRTSDEIRVSVGLIETLNGMQIWSQSYQYPLNVENLITIQDQIVENTCSILGGYYGFIVQDKFEKSRKPIPSLDSFDASLWNYYLHMNFTLEAYIQTRQALEHALKHDPTYALGMAMLAELYLDAYSLGYPTVNDPLTEAYDLAKNAIRLEPNCQHAYQEFGWANIYLKRKEEALKSMERCLELNPYSVSSQGAIGFGMACTGEYDRANELLTQSLHLNPHCPWWFYLGFFLVHYHSGEYQKSLEYANKIEVSDVFLDPLTKAVSKAGLGLYQEAKKDSDSFTQKFPEIAANLESHLTSFLLDDSLVADILLGFQKAQNAESLSS